MALLSSFPIIKPSLLLDFANVKALDPRITFTRTTTATYYDGKTTAKAEENLLLYSQEFETGWTNTRITKTANATAAPDGTTTADEFIEDATTGTHRANASAAGSIPANTTVTLSVFLKDNTRQYAVVGVGSQTSGSRWFAVTADLVAGTITQTDSGANGTYTSSSITSVGNGWYRIAVTGNIGTSTDAAANIQMSDSGTPSISDFMALSYAGDITKSYYAWGAQLEQRSAVTAYTPTTTAPITNYIPVLQTAASGVARFDHNPTTGESLGLLVEEQRTNLLLQSEDFSTTWSVTRSSITTNTIVAPDGTLTGDKLVEDTTASNSHFVSQAISWTSGTSYTLSMYAKKGERNWINMRLPSAGFTSSLDAYFDLNSGVVGSVTSPATSSITPVGNGWYRCSITAAATTTASGSLIVFIAEANGDVTFTGDGYSGIYIWGAQLEAGAFPTSYIPTTSASVTRNADAASMTGTNFSSWFRADEGTVYAEYIRNGLSPAGSVFAISDNTGSNLIGYRFGFAVPGQSRFDIRANAVDQANILMATQAVNTSYKTIGSYKVNDAAATQNGGSVTTDTSAILPEVNQAEIGEFSGNYLNGTIRKLAYYPSRLSDSQLQALTAS